MATIMGHSLVAGVFFKLIKMQKQSKLIFFFCLLGSILPDLDVIGFRLGIKYSDMLGHRGFTHSILFSLIYALSCLFIMKRYNIFKNIKALLLIFSSIMSHGIIDMLTDGGLGVGLLIPFSSQRFFFPFTPIKVSPIGVQFFSTRGLEVVINEFYYIALPCIGILLLLKYKFIHKKHNSLIDKFRK